MVLLSIRAFRDAICLRYGWRPSRLATECVCCNNFTVDHALSCLRSGFPDLRHNEIRDLTAQLLSETCPNVSIEPDFQPLTGKTLTYLTLMSELKYSGETDNKVHFLCKGF